MLSPPPLLWIWFCLINVHHDNYAFINLNIVEVFLNNYLKEFFLFTLSHEVYLISLEEQIILIRNEFFMQICYRL